MPAPSTRSALVAVIAAFAAGARAQTAPLQTSDVYRSAAKQVVEIRVIELKSSSKSQIGSGFFASANGAIITNFHVIAPLINEPGGYRAEWVETNGATHPLRVLGVDVVHDLAIVAADRPADRFFQIATAPPSQGTRLYALGNPNDLGLSIVEGTYNGFLQYTLYPRIHFTGAINAGMSGGPAITSDGRVVGVNVATAGNGVGFLVPVGRAAALLARVSAPGYTPPTDFMPEIATQVRAHQGEYFTSLLEDSASMVTLGAFTVPTRPAPFFKCWGDVTKGEAERRYDYVVHYCETDDPIYLSHDESTGYAVLKYWLYSSKELDPLRFYSLLEARYKTFATDMDGKQAQVTNFHCDTRNVRHRTGEHTEVVMRVATCLRAYKKMPGIYDMVTHVAVLGNKDTALIATLILAGVSYENAEGITDRLLQRIR